MNAVLVISVGALFWFISDLRKKIKLLFGGVDSDSETMQKDLIRRLARAETKIETLEPRLELVEQISKISVQKVGFKRFNPFQDTGGDNSFVLALLDRDNNGIIISSLYAREGGRLYGKSVEKGKSKHTLSDEEKNILEEAVQK